MWPGARDEGAGDWGAGLCGRNVKGEVASSKGLCGRFRGHLSGFCGKSVLWPGEVATYFSCGAVFLANWVVESIARRVMRVDTY